MVKQEEKLESARKRRENIRNMRTKRVMNSSRKHSEISTRVRQSKFVDDIDRQEQAQYMRQSNQNHVMMRKIYLGLMDQIHDLKKEERAHVIYSIYILQLKLYLIFWIIQALDRMNIIRNDAKLHLKVSIFFASW